MVSVSYVYVSALVLTHDGVDIAVLGIDDDIQMAGRVREDGQDLVRHGTVNCIIKYCAFLTEFLPRAATECIYA